MIQQSLLQFLFCKSVHLTVQKISTFRSLEKYYVIWRYFFHCNLYVVQTVKAIGSYRTSSFFNFFYHFVVPSSSSSISTLTCRFSKWSGRSLSLSLCNFLICLFWVLSICQGSLSGGPPALWSSPSFPKLLLHFLFLAALPCLLSSCLLA